MFNPTYDYVDPREVWRAHYYNALIADLVTAFANVPGSSLEAPLQLTRSGQDLDGYGHNVYGFRRWFGHGGSVAVRDAAGFGATGLGTADDSAGIQSAIDDLPQSGGVVFLPPGTYLIDASQIDLAGSESAPQRQRDYVSLVGCGPSTILYLADNADHDILRIGRGRTGMSVCGLTIAGNASHQTLVGLRGIDARGSIKATISNCWIDNVHGFGLSMGASDGLDVHNCIITNSSQDGITHESESSAAHFRVSGCLIDSSGVNGIGLGAAGYGTVSRCILTNQVFGSGVLIQASALSGVKGISVRSCFVSTGLRGIHVLNDVPGMSVTGVLIAGNSIDSVDEDGILLAGAGSSVIQGTSLANNSVTKCGKNGIYISAGCAGVAVNANVSYNNGNAVASSGICIQGTTTVKARLVSLTGNSCYDDRAGSATQDKGIYLANCEDCCVVANTVYGNVSNQIYDVGTRTDRGHNIGDV